MQLFALLPDIFPTGGLLYAQHEFLSNVFTSFSIISVLYSICI